MPPSTPAQAPEPIAAILPEELPGLVGRLFRRPYGFDFFQAVRLLQLLYPKRPRVGRGGPAEAEVVRFRAHLSLNFPPSQIYDLTLPTQARPFSLLTQSFLGLTGPSGVLPRHYTELLLRLQRDSRGPERTALREWFDLFNHRLVSLFFRAWEKYRFPISFEHSDPESSESDPFTNVLLSYVGVGLPSLRRRLRVTTIDGEDPRAPIRTLARVNDLSLLYYAGYFAHRPRNAVSLQGLLSDYFGLDAEVQQFRGQWLLLEPENLTRLGDEGLGNELGASTIAGDRVWDVRSKIRIRLGPLSYDRFGDLIPDPTPSSERKSFYLLSHLVRLYVGPELDFEVQLVLKADEVPESRLVEGDGLGARLGWNTWLLSQTPESDADEPIFQGAEVVELPKEPVLAML